MKSPQTLSEFVGNQTVTTRLQAALDSSRLSHAYLIDGPIGSGKKTLARLFARAALCTGASRPCGSCSACLKSTSGHPDVRWIDTGGAASIGVDVVRQLRPDVFIVPNESAYKFYIICEADKMTPQAQNALLLIFEEPPPYAIFLLLCENAEDMLPTIRSRASRVSLHAVLPEECTAYLTGQGISAKEAETASASAGFFIGQALSFLTDADSKQSREQAVQFLRCLISGKEHELLSLLKKTGSSKPSFQRFLSSYEELTRDVLAAKAKAPVPLYFEGERPLVLQAAAALTNTQLADIMRHIKQSILRLDTNVNLSMSAMVLCIQCWEAIH